MFKRILGTVVEAIARRKPAVPPPLPRRSRPVESAGNANASANAAGPVSRAAEQRLATATLTDTARLVEMTAQTDTRAAALARLAELAAGDGIGDLLLRHPELEIELLLASHDAAYAERTLSTVTAAQTLIRVATHAQTPRVRQLAAARITSATDLVELERSSRGHDKAVHRAAKAGLDARRRQQAELADHGAALQQLRERVLQLQRSEHDPLHNARLDHLQRSFAAWQQRAGELTAAAPDGAPAEWVTQDISAALAQASERAAAAAEAIAETVAAATAAAIAATAEATTEAIAVDTTPVPAGPDGPLPATASPAAPEAIAAAAPVPVPDPADADQLQEYAQAIADLDAVLEDVCRDPSQVLDRLALVPPALQLLHRRWSAVSGALDRNGSSSAAPIVWRGLSEPNGFWKTICTRGRKALRVVASAWATSTPSITSRPAVGGSIIVSTRAKVDLPQPDSPTMARVRPAATVNDTPASAFTTPGALNSPRPTRYSRVRLSASSSGGAVLMPQPPGATAGLCATVRGSARAPAPPKPASALASGNDQMRVRSAAQKHSLASGPTRRAPHQVSR